MRVSFVVLVLLGAAACGDDSAVTPPVDLSMTVSNDMAVVQSQPDIKTVTPFNMPGSVDCYSGPKCSTASATPICCDAKADGGFSDTCVASTGACMAIDPKAKVFACGQAADCGAGMVCCGDNGMASSGKPFIDNSVCAASCTGKTPTQLCVTAAECKTGTTCVGQTVSGRDIGVCM